MSEKPQHFDPLDPVQAQRRAAARQRLDAIDPARTGEPLADPFRRQWFEAVYALAEGDAVNVPWGNLAPHPLLTAWLGAHKRLDGLDALDIGCGLGDNAAAMAGQGARVTAFDLVPAAADWARRRFADNNMTFFAADLFAPPDEWREAFDFVNEIYTLQALPPELLTPARQALADLVKPGGQLLVICRARDEAQAIDGPPWPLARSDIEGFADHGLVLEALEDCAAHAGRQRHWRALLRKS